MIFRKTKSPLLKQGRNGFPPVVLIASGAGILLLAAAVFLFLSSQPQPFQLQNCTSVDRNAYALPSSIFEEIPSPPKCLLTIARIFQQGRFDDAFFFTPAYYLQPEFYGNFSQEGIKYWTSPDAAHYGAVGFGALPYQQTIQLHPNESKTIRVFMHSGFGVRTTQGLSLVPRYGDPQDTRHVQVELSRDAKDGFILGPSFPKFSREWVKPIDITLRVLPAAVTGVVTIDFATQPPNSEKETEFRAKYPFYFNATDYVGAQTPFQIQVEITPNP